jgi:hypothetical protein
MFELSDEMLAAVSMRKRKDISLVSMVFPTVARHFLTRYFCHYE